MKYHAVALPVAPLFGRSPCGERGLKCSGVLALLDHEMSLPVRGAWIEIKAQGIYFFRLASLPVRGAWIEMPCPCAWHDGRRRRSPCGERGLKLPPSSPLRQRHKSLPVRGAWIEIYTVAQLYTYAQSSLPVRGAWIEIR